MKKKLIFAICVLFFLTILGPLPVGYYYLRNKVLAHHSHGLIKADDNIVVNWFRWWPKAMELGIYLANPGGAIHMPPNYTETLTANLVLKSNTALIFDGPANITQGAFSVTMPSGITNPSMFAPFTHSTNDAGNNLGVSFQGYTGSGAAFDWGDSSGFVQNPRFSGIHIDLSSALANAIAFRITNAKGGNFDDWGCTGGGVSGQKCFVTVGTGAFFAGLNRVMNLDCNYSASATNGICMQFGTISNAWQVIGGHANMGGSANGSVCIDVASGGSGVLPWGFDCDVSQTAVTVESTVNTAIFGFVRVDSGTTNSANFAAGSFGNQLWINGNLPFTDNGTSGTNSIINPARNNFRTDVWQNSIGATFSFFEKDLLDSGNARRTYVNGPGGDSRYDPGSGGSGLTRFCVAVVCAGLSIESNGTRGVLIDGSGRYIATETTSSGAGAGKDVMYADSTAHRMELSNNNGSFFPITQTIGSSTVTTAGTAVTNGTCQAQTGITITGSLTTDQAVANINAALPATWQTGIQWRAEVSAAGTCTVNLCNPTAGSITPAATAVRCTVTR